MRMGTALLVLTVGLSGLCAHSQVDLGGDWKFRAGDDHAWRAPTFDDSGWENLKTGEPWDTQGHAGYVGYGWYRKAFALPSSVRDDAPYQDHVLIAFPGIRDHGDVYLNGRLLTQFDRPEVDEAYYQSYPHRPRYFIPVGDPALLWDKENVLAVRVNHFINCFKSTGHIGGGLEWGAPSLSMASFNDYVDIRRVESMPRPIDAGEPIPILLEATNRANRAVQATLSVRIVVESSNGAAFSEMDEVVLPNQNPALFRFAYTPTTNKNHLLRYTLKDSRSDNAITWSQLFAYPKLPEKKSDTPVAAIIPNKIPNQITTVPYENLKIGGLLGRWVDHNGRMGVREYVKRYEYELLDCFYGRPGPFNLYAANGEYLGKFIEGAIKTGWYTGDKELMAHVNRMMEVLVACQREDGYLGTQPEGSRWQGWDTWIHKYNLVGLLMHYGATGYQPSLDAARGMGDVMCESFGTEEGLQDIGEGSSKGMARTSVLEPMTWLYRYTGAQKYLDFCKYIVSAYEQPHSSRIVSTLLETGRVDNVANRKGYEMLSNLVGMVYLYQLTGEEDLVKACTIAWDDIAENRLYITGSTTAGEFFTDDHVLPGGANEWPCESCVTAHWFRLTRALFNLTGEMKYMNELEKTIYNHLLGSLHPGDGSIVYYCPLEDPKPYMFTLNCCNSSLPREIASIPELVWCKPKEGGLQVLIYNPGTLQGSITTSSGDAVDIRLTIESDFPKNGRVTILVEPDEPTEFQVALRVPDWCSSFTARLAGEEFVGKVGELVQIERSWAMKEEIAVDIGLAVQLIEGGLSYPGHHAIKVGPQVLALDSSVNRGIKNLHDVRVKPNADVRLIPASNRLPEGWIGEHAYTCTAVVAEDGQEVILVPYRDASQKGGDMRTWIAAANGSS